MYSAVCFHVLVVLISYVSAQSSSRAFDCLNTIHDKSLDAKQWKLYAAIADRTSAYTRNVYVVSGDSRQSIYDLADIEHREIVVGAVRIENENELKFCNTSHNFVLLAVAIDEYNEPEFSIAGDTGDTVYSSALDYFILSPTGIVYLNMEKVQAVDIYGGLRIGDDKPLVSLTESQKQLILYASAITISQPANNTDKEMIFTYSAKPTGIGIRHPTRQIQIASSSSQLYSQILFTAENVEWMMLDQNYTITATMQWYFGKDDDYLSIDTAGLRSTVEIGYGQVVLLLNPTDRLQIEYVTPLQRADVEPQFHDSFLATLDVDVPFCTCIPNAVWLDIVYVVDVSKDMTGDGVDEITDMIRDGLEQNNLGSFDYQTRVAVVTYAKTAAVSYTFDQLVSSADVENLRIVYSGESGTNITGGIAAARSLFASASTRSARKVIVLVASAFRSEDSGDPRPQAESFKNSGGVIIALDYVHSGAPSVSVLNEIASAGYSYSDSKGNFTTNDLLSALCQANCFCRPGASTYSTNERLTPDGGCYEFVNTATDYASAKKTCESRNAKMVTVHDKDKELYLTSLLPPKKPFWLGLASLKWDDGYLYYTSYQNWADGQPSSAGDCTIVQQYSGFQIGWFSADCYQPQAYFCQSRPCDTTFNCL